MLTEQVDLRARGRYVLMFHDVASSHASETGFSIDAGRFEEYLHVINEYSMEVTEDATPIVTFDDGYISHYETVLPLMNSLSMSAVFFVITQRIGAPGFLGRNHLLEMLEAGMRIGSHTMSHPNIGLVEDSQIINELKLSKEYLEETLSTPCVDLALPGGHGTKVVKGVFDKLGYKRVYTSVPTPWDGLSSVVPRLCVKSSLTPDELAEILEGGVTKFVALARMKNVVRSVLGPRLYSFASEIRRQIHGPRASS